MWLPFLCSFMSKIAAKVPDIELYIPGGKKKIQKEGTSIGHQQYLTEVSGKLLYIPLASMERHGCT